MENWQIPDPSSLSLFFYHDFIRILIKLCYKMLGQKLRKGLFCSMSLFVTGKSLVASERGLAVVEQSTASI